MLKRTSINKCVLKTILTSDNQFYTNDSEITYYSYNLFNDVNNCDECSNGNTCDKCLEGYDLYNNNKLCVRKEDIENNLYFKINTSIVIPCSSLIQDCNKCSNTDTCFECQDEAGLTINKTCVNEALFEENHEYYKDENNKYVSCSIMPHCRTCNSDSACISCQEGFVLNNNQCNESEEEKNNRLSKRTIVGITLGSILFLLVIIGIAYLIYKKKYKINKNGYQPTYDVVEIGMEKTERNKEKEGQPQDTEKRNSENCVVYKRKSISNLHN